MFRGTVSRRAALLEIEEWRYDTFEPVRGGCVLMGDDPAQVIAAARSALEEAGVEIDGWLEPAVEAVLIAEAVNLAAKVIDEGFYRMKPSVWAAAARVDGVSAWWGTDGCLYLYAVGAGEVCAHDPWGELRELTERYVSRWDDAWWSGLRRQGWAFEALRNEGVREAFEAHARGDLNLSQVEAEVDAMYAEEAAA